MSYNGSGTFVINSAGMPLVPFQRDLSATFNALTADLATGLSTAITKDGQTTTTALITFAAGISSTLATDATSISTGSLLTSGGLGVTKAAWIGGLINVAGAATLQSTLAVTGTSTMAAINASGNINVSSSNIVLTAATGAINAVGALTLAPASANPLLTLTDATKGSGYIQGGVNTGGTGAGDYWIFNVPTSRGLSWAVNNSTVLNAVAAGVTIPGTLGVTGLVTGDAGFAQIKNTGIMINGAQHTIGHAYPTGMFVIREFQVSGDMAIYLFSTDASTPVRLVDGSSNWSAAPSGASFNVWMNGADLVIQNTAGNNRAFKYSLLYAG